MLCNDFNNLVMQTLWWLPNKILRHIHKKRFSIFLSRFLRICNQSVQKVLIKEKNVIMKKFNLGIKKRRISRWFRIRWKSFEKMHPKKVISKNVTEICTFFTFTYVRQTCFACNFFWCIFLQVFQRIRNQREILRFLISFLHFLQTLKPNAQQNGSKNQKTYLVNVS